MTHDAAGALLGSYFLLAIAGFVFMFITLVMAPFMMFLGVRRLGKIARELERANDYREHYNHGVIAGPIGEPSRSLAQVAPPLNRHLVQ